MSRRSNEQRSSARGQGDRFDSVPRSSRVGAHRAVEKHGSPGAWVLISTLAALILTALGILLYTLQPGSVPFLEGRGNGQESVKPVEAEVSPETVVAVLNGSQVESLAFGVETVITQEGWGKVGMASNAVDRDVEISGIFYSDEADEGLAKGLGDKLGGVAYYQNPNYMVEDSQITVLLGNDYQGPGLEEAQRLNAESE